MSLPTQVVIEYDSKIYSAIVSTEKFANSREANHAAKLPRHDMSKLEKIPKMHIGEQLVFLKRDRNYEKNDIANILRIHAPKDATAYQLNCTKENSVFRLLVDFYKI